MFNSDMIGVALSKLQKLMKKPEYIKFKDNKQVVFALFAKILNDMEI